MYTHSLAMNNSQNKVHTIHGVVVVLGNHNTVFRLLDKFHAVNASTRVTTAGKHNAHTD